jgi:TolA-binding protein
LNEKEAAEFKYEEGLYYYRQKNYQKASECFSDVIDDHEKTEFAGWSAYWNGKIAETADKIAEAQKSYGWVIERFPNSEPAIEANLSLGNYYFRSEKYAEAVKYYRNISDKPLKDGATYSAALDNIIEAYFQLQIYDASIEYCRKFISAFPTDKSIPEKKLKIGILYQKLRYYDQAIVHYQSLIENAGSALEVEIRYYLGECYFSKGDYSQALLEFMKVPYISGKSTKIDWIPAALYMSGQSYEKMNKYEQAITMYRQIIEKPNIDNTYKAQAQKEIDRVKALILPQKGKE